MPLKKENAYLTDPATSKSSSSCCVFFYKNSRERHKKVYLFIKIFEIFFSWFVFSYIDGVVAFSMPQTPTG